MSLINCEISPNLTWWSTIVIIYSTGEGKFAITGAKLYVPAVTLSTQNNAKLFKQLKSGFLKKQLTETNIYQKNQ